MSIERDHRIVAQSRCPLLLHRLKFVPNTISELQCFSVSPFQCFTVAMFQPVLADLPVADRQPTGAKGTQIVSTLLPSNSLYCGLSLQTSSTRPSRPSRGCHRILTWKLPALAISRASTLRQENTSGAAGNSGAEWLRRSVLHRLLAKQTRVLWPRQSGQSQRGSRTNSRQPLPLHAETPCSSRPSCYVYPDVLQLT